MRAGSARIGNNGDCAETNRRPYYAADSRARSRDLTQALRRAAVELDEIMDAGKVRGHLTHSPGEGRQGRGVRVAGMRFHRLSLLRAAR
jgi:hypothetical protein